jgi:hypothetical protein
MKTQTQIKVFTTIQEAWEFMHLCDREGFVAGYPEENAQGYFYVSYFPSSAIVKN